MLMLLHRMSACNIANKVWTHLVIPGDVWKGREKKEAGRDSRGVPSRQKVH
jgi:hypothetical protein